VQTQPRPSGLISQDRSISRNTNRPRRAPRWNSESLKNERIQNFERRFKSFRQWKFSGLSTILPRLRAEVSLYALAMASKPKQPHGPPMTTPSDTPDENERRAQDCRAKAAYCKWVASISPDETLRKFYAELSVEWEKEAAK
jgi:hypothetical protein